MLTTTSFLVLVVMQIILSGSQANANTGLREDKQCRDGWAYYENQCYWWSDYGLSWDQAQTFCLKEHSTLAQPYNMIGFIELMRKLGKATGRPGTIWHIGVETIFKWISRGDVNFGEPANNCVDLTWKDYNTPILKEISCTDRSSWFICGYHL